MNISENAKIFAIQKHKSQQRKNGEPYIVHPISVATLLIKYKQSHNIDNLVAAAYLHDTIEDTNTTFYELAQNFGFNVASLVMELTTDKAMKNEIGKTKYLALKLNSMTKWALAIKLCDRLDNISDLNIMDENFRNRYSEETIYIINYICENRELSKTHISIIKEIMNILSQFKKNINIKQYMI